MKVTSVNVKKIEKEGSRMKGIASILLDDLIAIHDIRIISGDNGLFVAMPSRKKEITIKDNNGNNVLDRNGEKVVENVQLYNIYKLK